MGSWALVCLVHSRNPRVQRCPVHCRCSINVQGMLNELVLVTWEDWAHQSFHCLAVWAPGPPLVRFGHFGSHHSHQDVVVPALPLQTPVLRLSVSCQRQQCWGEWQLPQGCKELIRSLDRRLLSFLEILQSFPSIVFGCSFLS